MHLDKVLEWVRFGRRAGEKHPKQRKQENLSVFREKQVAPCESEEPSSGEAGSYRRTQSRAIE